MVSIVDWKCRGPGVCHCALEAPHLPKDFYTHLLARHNRAGRLFKLRWRSSSAISPLSPIFCQPPHKGNQCQISLRSRERSIQYYRFGLGDTLQVCFRIASHSWFSSFRADTPPVIGLPPVRNLCRVVALRTKSDHTHSISVLLLIPAADVPGHYQSQRSCINERGTST